MPDAKTTAASKTTSDGSRTYIGLYNPKSPTNVGAVLRAAGCFQAAKILYTGTRYELAAKHATDTKNRQSNIPLVSVSDLIESIPHEMKIICVELAEGAEALPTFSHPNNATYIFGPEDGSLPQAVIDNADHVIYIPTIGCMNLAATVNVVLYDRLAKQGDKALSDDLTIQKNRDKNNRLVVREAT